MKYEWKKSTNPGFSSRPNTLNLKNPPQKTFFQAETPCNKFYFTLFQSADILVFLICSSKFAIFTENKNLFGCKTFKKGTLDF